MKGFGTSVIQRLCKTSVKKNLYWEVKDKVIEEAFNGYRMDKVHRMVKVYGIDSTKAVRARLIEILMERVRYHKDKFICPIIWDEMRSMETKRNGKVEHSDKTHDDTVFGYLMALYVWYDGKNLVENFGIRKSTLKTDQDQEIDEDFFEDAIEKKEKISIDNGINIEREDIIESLQWVEKDVGITTSQQLKQQQYLDKIIQRETILANNPVINDKYIQEHGINVSPNQQYAMVKDTVLPDSLFNMDYDPDYDGIDVGDKVNVSINGTPLAGNLSSFYDML